MRNTGTRDLPWRQLVLAALCLTVFFAPGHFATPDAHVRLAQARNFVESGSFAVPEGTGNMTHGNLAPGRDGKMYSVYNVGHSLLLAPIYALASSLPFSSDLHNHYRAAFFGSFLGLLAHFVTGLVILGILVHLGVNRRQSILVAALFALGTVALPSATDGYEHPFEALAVSTAFLCAIVAERQRLSTRSCLLAGFFIGLGLLFRYTAVLALPGLLLTLRSGRARLLALTGILPGLFGTLIFNWYRFGSLLDTGYLTAWRLSHGTIIGTSGFDLSQIPRNTVHLLTSPGKGLIWFAPAIILGLISLRVLRRKHPHLAIGIIATGIAYVLFYSANFAWHGSVWSWGPRYLIPTVPLLILPFAFCTLSRPWIWLSRLIIIWSISIQAVAVTADYRRHLLLEYSKNPPDFEQQLLHDPRVSPVLGQYQSAIHVVRSTLSSRIFHAYIPEGPWQDVDRPVSTEMMLESSIDLNVINLWWMRLPFFLPRGLPTYLCYVFGGLLLLAGTVLLRSIWLTSE